MRVYMDDIHVPDMIHLHKTTREIIYTYLLNSTHKLSRLHSTKSKVENQLRQEKMEKQAQIKKLRTDLLVVENQEDKGARIQKLMNEQENAIHLLQKKLNIPSNWLIQVSKLAELEKEKEVLNGELTDCKAKLLKYAEKREIMAVRHDSCSRK